MSFGIENLRSSAKWTMPENSQHEPTKGSMMKRDELVCALACIVHRGVRYLRRNIRWFDRRSTDREAA
jgi:hypothetical protein